MKILLSMPNDGQSNNYIINALQELDHEVVFVDHRRAFKEAIEGIPDLIRMYQPDLMLVLYLVPGNTYSAEYIKMLKYTFPNVKFASWIFDTTIQGQYCDENQEFIKIVKEYDYFFTVVRGQVENFRKQKVNAFFLHEGFDQFTVRFNLNRQDIDVSFMGQLGRPEPHVGRIALLEKIIKSGIDLTLYGALGDMGELLFKHHVGRPTFNDIEHSKVAARSKINLGLSGWPHLDGYFSARNYRIMGVGGFLIANRSKGIEDFFVEDKEIVLFDTPEECIEKIKFYLARPESRNAIANAGKHRVLDDYKFKDCMEKMLKVIE